MTTEELDPVTASDTGPLLAAYPRVRFLMLVLFVLLFGLRVFQGCEPWRNSELRLLVSTADGRAIPAVIEEPSGAIHTDDQGTAMISGDWKGASLLIRRVGAGAARTHVFPLPKGAGTFVRIVLPEEL